jgi:uncharacterized membrane protein
VSVGDYHSERTMGNLLATTSARRVEGIDAVRGTVMVLMALDHVRDFIHCGAMSYSPTDLSQTTPPVFFTRWVTHFCAPTFMLLAGVGAFLWQHGKRTKPQLSTFLFTRGLWLIALELTAMQLGIYFDVSLKYPIFLLVLWALGVSMIVLALLIWLPIPVLAVLSIAVITLHDLLDGVNAAQLGTAAWAWNLLHQPGAFRLAGATIIVGYPLVPWVAVMALGFCLGPQFLIERAVRRSRLTVIGAATTLAFLVLRALNGYGDPQPWAVQHSPVYTAMSYLNTTKYPPSVDFLLMTLGPSLLALAWFDRPGLKRSNPLVVFGRVPLLYFVVHFYAAHAAAVLLALARYGTGALAFIFQPLPSMGGPSDLFPAEFGYDLWVVYLVWAIIVLALYPACRWFAAIKAKQHDWWLSYL